MKSSALFLVLFFLPHVGVLSHGENSSVPQFTKRVIIDKLSDPWEITYGPDGFLWITEAKGYRVSKLDPHTGYRKVLLDLHNLKNFGRYDQEKDDGGKPWPQGGLMGMALHPRLLEGKPYVYLAYIYHFAGVEKEGNGCLPDFGGCFFTGRLVRYTYKIDGDTLIDPEILCDTIPASSDHNGGRLLIAPVEGQDFLFYSIGDMGAGQFTNGGRPNHAQDTHAYQGKILRFNLEPDSDSSGYDGWIPADNPYNSGKRNAVWTLGHRNPEGLAFAMDKIYSVEHGPFSDDEVNIIEKGKNYGHPLIIGFADGNYNGLAAASSAHEKLPGRWHTTYPTIVSEQKNAKALGNNYRDPIKSFYPTPYDTLKKIVKKLRRGEEQKWISEAPSSLAVYTSDAIPEWKSSLLITTLKTGKVIRLKLNSDGSALASDTITYFKSKNRYRDLAISPDGRKIYLAVDSVAQSSEPSKDFDSDQGCTGCIIEYSLKN